MNANNPVITLNKTQIFKNGGTLGMSYILQSLRDSEVFNIEYHDDYIEAPKGNRGTIIYYKNKKIYVDFWEYAYPTFSEQIYNGNFDLIIKLQRARLEPRRYINYINRKNILRNISDEKRIEFYKEIIPWTFFPSKLLNIYTGRESEFKCNSLINGFFCGRHWKCRRKILKYLEKNHFEVMKSDQKRGEVTLANEEYLQKMLDSKYGIVLSGRSTIITDCKTRREIEYMMMKKPLLLNYKPYYYNELTEGVHYIYIDEKTDFNSLDKIHDIDKIALNGHKWYLDNASPLGVAKTFKKIIDEKFSL